jgi:tetratricopeptide (TPR) repeat protein
MATSTTSVGSIRKRPASRWGALCRGCALAILLALVFPTAVLAAQTVDQRTGKRLNAVQEFLMEEQYDEAEKVLQGFSLTRLNPYERALVFQMYGYIYAGREDYATSVDYFEKCLAEEALPEESAINLRFNIAQLYMATQRWDDALAALLRWFDEVEEANSNAYYVLAIAYYQKFSETDDVSYKKKALEPARKAVELAKTPRQNWLQLLLALYLDEKLYDKALPILEQLVTLYPKKSYWLQLSAIYGELGKDKESLAAQQLAYVQGMLTKDEELQRFAQLYLYYDLPWRAAKVVERGLEEAVIEEDSESLELLANALLSAREYEAALGPLDRAASLAESGDLYVRLGQVYIQREEWAKASTALESALAKGDLDDPCQSQVLLGITNYSQGNKGTARNWFQRASSDEKCEEQSARWLQHLQRESQQGG